MYLIVNGENLDIISKDVSIHFANMRFTDSLSDEYTTDITIPRTKHNNEVLDAVCVLDRRVQMFGAKIPCVVGIGSSVSDGYISIDSISASSISATVYIPKITKDFLSMKLREARPDDSSSIFAWYKNTTIGNIFNEFGFPYYDYGTGSSTDYAQHHPAVRLSALMSDIATRFGVTMPTIGHDLVVVAANKKVCPQNRRQTLAFYCGSNTNKAYILDGGQHICDDYDPNTHVDARNGELTSDVTKITFNREASVSMTISAIKRMYTSGTSAALRLYINGTYKATLSSSSAGAAEISTTASFTVSSGDVMTLKQDDTAHAATWHGFVDMTITGYEIYDKDYDIELYYHGYVPCVNYVQAYTVSGLNSYDYIGTICNIADMTVKQLLSSMCWYIGLNIRQEGQAIVVDNTNVYKEINATITEYSPICDKLGKETIVMYNGGDASAVLNIDNDLLEESKTLHESVFSIMYKGVDAARIDQYEILVEMDENVQVTKGHHIYSGGSPLGIYTATEGVLSSARVSVPGNLTLLGLEKLKFVTQITATTYDNISGCDYVYVDGHKYMVIEGDRDVETGLTEFKALLI